ncbi:hypothetical protein QBC46DRAFT_399148 [Diplogelasinospora grovesii]|uniref:Amidoligase enzyme n=1 Tax=Diplogelasinospora grovesii TaxID=303347 RepID=A0AAN6MWE1_9PEZI|nr:hypothetical protein QBC46DRAFT_399148 [Diplogelasinospora grovesii]
MEAVSPILDTGAGWADEIDTFWEAMRAVFHMPQRAGVCGSHVHVSRGRNQRFTLAELKTIAYGIVVYEDLVLELLMAYRQDNAYCKPNSEHSTLLQRAAGNRVAIANMISGAATPEALRDIMQNSRYVLWNFDNVAMNKSGTVEFRGGRFLRGEVRTKRWMAFAVAFIHAMLRMNDLANNGLSARSAAALYSEIKRAAQQLGMGEFLPSKVGVLNETLPST